MRDPRDRTYLYASNIAVDKGRPQPVHFLFGEDLLLTDARGREMLARIVAAPPQGSRRAGILVLPVGQLVP